MINIEYNGEAQESAKATLDFLSNRPFIRLMFVLMQASCVILCIGFVITLYTKSARPQDAVSVVFAVLWLFFYKPINRWIIKRNLKRVKFNDSLNTFKIDHKSIFYKPDLKQPVNVEWNRLKYILQNQDGYIIPITGIGNGGKFLWLPYRAFKAKDLENQFLDLINKFKLKIKTIKG